MPRSQRPPAVYPCGRARLTRVPPATECACPNLPYTPLFRSLTVPQNMALLRRLRELTALGRPLFIGTSRKGSIGRDRKSTRLNSSHVKISYAVFCLKKKNQQHRLEGREFTHTYPDRSRRHSR